MQRPQIGLTVQFGGGALAWKQEAWFWPLLYYRLAAQSWASPSSLGPQNSVVQWGEHSELSALPARVSQGSPVFLCYTRGHTV